MHWETGVRKLAREIPALPAARMVLCLFLVLWLVSQSCTAQQPESGGQLPDAPSATAHGPSDEKHDSMDSETIELVVRRSRVFPNLAMSTEPMTAGQKFGLFASNSVSIYTVGGAAMGAGINQARNAQAGYGQGAEGYFKRFGASMALAASNNFFGTFLLPSLLHQDPRFFVRDTGNFGDKVWYATSRIIITRSDRGGETINWSGILGPLAGAALANTYLPDDSQGVGNTFARWGTTLASTAGSNVLREFWPSIARGLRPKKNGPKSPATVDPAPSPKAAPTPPHSD
jgi:hypothetical protein